MSHDIPFREDLNQKPPRTYQEFLERAQDFINAENAKSLVLKSTIVVPNNVITSTNPMRDMEKRR